MGHQITAKYSILEAKINLRSAIYELLKALEQYSTEIDGVYDEATRKVRTDNINENKYILQGINEALKPIFGNEINNKLFTAINHCFYSDIDIAELNKIISEIERIECFD